MDSIVHFEIPAKNVKRASKFYSSAFGWKIEKYPGFSYWGLTTTPTGKNGMPSKPGAINGGMGKKGKNAPDLVTVTIQVKNIDSALKTVAKVGGKVTEKKTPVGDMGFTAYFSDTEGNVIGLYQSNRKR